MSDWTSAVDPASGSTYYYNSATGETRWDAPEEMAAAAAAEPAADASAENAADWAAAVDPGSGATYYYNSVTGLTTWEKPQVVADAEAAAASGAVTVDTTSPTKAAAASAGATAGSGSGGSTPKSPSKRISAKERLEKRKLSIMKKRNAAKEVDKGPKKELSISEKLKARSARFARSRQKATKKNVFRVKPPPAREPSADGAAAAPVDTTAALAEGWMELTDPDSGSVYYYNENTQETSWDRPTA